MKSFNEWMKSRIEENSIDPNQFLSAVGITRQMLTNAYKVLNRNNETPESIANYMQQLCQIISRELKPFDRKPVFGNNIEFRMINTGLGSFVSPDNSLPLWIQQAINSGNKKELMQKVEAAEKELMGFYKSLSGDNQNTSFVDLHKQANKNFGS